MDKNRIINDLLDTIEGLNKGTIDVQVAEEIVSIAALIENLDKNIPDKAAGKDPEEVVNQFREFSEKKILPVINLDGIGPVQPTVKTTKVNNRAAITLGLSRGSIGFNMACLELLKLKPGSRVKIENNPQNETFLYSVIEHPDGKTLKKYGYEVLIMDKPVIEDIIKVLAVKEPFTSVVIPVDAEGDLELWEYKLNNLRRGIKKTAEIAETTKKIKERKVKSGGKTDHDGQYADPKKLFSEYN